MDSRHPKGIPSRPLVLVVDEHDDTRDLYIAGLTAFGFEAIEASDGEQAFREAWETRPDVVVTELALPAADGWQLIQNLKRGPRTRDIPVVMLTGHVAPSVRERAEREGCAAFFTKPCLPDALATELRQVVDSRTFMKARERPTDGDTRPCPQCRSTLVFSSHYPVLAVRTALSGLGSEAGDRLRYERAWVCRNGGCNYRDIEGCT